MITEFEVVGGKKGTVLGKWPTLSSALEAVHGMEPRGYHVVRFSVAGEVVTLGRFNFSDHELFRVSADPKGRDQ